MNNPTTSRMLNAIGFMQETMPQRGYLGMSGIGHPCVAKSWFDFRLASFNEFPASTICKFDDGHYSEELTAKRLRMVHSISLTTHIDDKQIGHSDLGGHFRGHMDGVISGVVQNPEQEFVWEHKCCDEKVRNKAQKLCEKYGENNTLKEWNEIYFAQAQIYMHYSKIPQHFLTIATSGSREYMELVTLYDKEYSASIIAKAHNIIASDSMPEKIKDTDDKRAFMSCKFCNHNDICQGDKLPLPHCRTCRFSKPIIDGTSEAKWHCAKHEKLLTFEEQIESCKEHQFIPVFLNNWAAQIDYTNDSVTYEKRDDYTVFSNGSLDECFSSLDLCLIEEKEELNSIKPEHKNNQLWATTI